MSNTNFLVEGKQVELQFVADATTEKNVVIMATDEQDVEEHWDVSIDNIKIDVKGLKKRKREDGKVDETIHFIELNNVHGKQGWLYGQADYIAFETIDTWVMVKRTKLAEYIDKKLILACVDTPEEYKIYCRPYRLDQMTIVPTADLVKIATRVILKKI